MKILIPESEGKKSEGVHKPLTQLHPVTKQLLTTIKSYDGSLETLYGVKEKLATTTHSLNVSIEQSKTLPAIERFTGVVFKGIEYTSLSMSAKRVAKKKLYIMTSLFGLVNCVEKIPNYKLKINKLKADKLWHEQLIINEPVIDLLPQAHKKAIQLPQAIRIEFVVLKQGKKKPAGHMGKFIKGRFVRYLLENNISQTEQMLAFTEEGFVGKQINDMLIEFVKIE